MKLVVEQLALVEAPGLVLAVRLAVELGLVVVDVPYLAAVPRIAQQEQVALLELLSRRLDALSDGRSRRLLGQQDLDVEPLDFRDGRSELDRW